MLDCTPAESIERKATKINPTNICQPIGAAYAALGIHKAMGHSHGSQGCSSYYRSQITRHYREAILGTTSSFTEGSAVFGGMANLKEAISNITSLYKPEIIAIHTTCVSETIGDDVRSFVREIDNNGGIPEGVRVVAASTPSYVGTHLTGYARMVEAIFEEFAEKGEANGKINIIPGFNCEPGDIREIKRILNLMGIESIVVPDTTDVLDSGMTGKLEVYPKGGTTIPELIDTANSMATFAICQESCVLGAAKLASKFDVPAVPLQTPIGIRSVDKMLMKLAEVTGKEIPEELKSERARLVDMMTDAHPHFHGKKVAISGDPDIVSGMTSLVVDMGMIPTHILSGTKSKFFEKDIKEILGDKFPEANVVGNGDLFGLHQMIKKEPVDLILGNSHTKFIARAEDIPLIRVGFPISDRANMHHFPVMGYAGAMRMVERIGNTLLDRFDRDASDERFELLL